MDKDTKYPDVLKSISSLSAFKSLHSSASVLECPIEYKVDFADAVVAIANNFECPINIDVCTLSLPKDETISKTERHRKRTTARGKFKVKSVAPESKVTPSSSDDEEKHRKTSNLDDSVLTLTTAYNVKNRLVAISINRYRYTQIPRIILQVLGIVLPSYTKLTKFSIQDCFIDKYTILELKNLLFVTNITDVSLDNSTLPEANYDVLLQQATSLRYLSLKRCSINDEVCERIVSKLHFHQSPKNMLLTLNLSSNHITDDGAKLIGEALRSNRHLRYLNLADNLITDDGAKYIFNALSQFLLTSDELYQKREQCFDYLRRRNIIGSENAITSKIMKSPRRKTLSISSGSLLQSVKTKVSSRVDKRKSSGYASSVNVKVDLIASEILASFEHPFHKSQLIMKEGLIYCKGNLLLSYLNLAYNNLMYPSLKTLLEVLEYQKIHRNDNWRGLIKVVFDGNHFPIDCMELDSINVRFKEITRKLSRNRTSKGSI